MRIACLLRSFVLVLACVPLLGHPALAQRSADTLRVVWRDSISSLDPYYNQSRGAFVVAHEVWDTLVYRDPASFKIKPLLAIGWTWEDDRTLLFTLRDGVRWQNGDPFTAEDVAYTINMIVSDPRLSTLALYNWIADAEVIDAQHVRIRLNRVMPAALDYFAMVVWILPKAYREKVGPENFAHSPIGSGPYRVTHIDEGGGIDLVRFDGYYAGSPKGTPAIRHIDIRPVPNTTTQVASLLSGQADWTWKIDPGQVEVLNGDPYLTAEEADSMRISYLSLDAAGRTGAGNPLTSEQVRRAIAHAIDRSALAHDLAGARPLSVPCYPSQVGCDVQAASPIAYDPDRARTLLAQAGYPHGFAVQLTTYEPASWSAAIQSYLRAVGIDAQVIQLPAGEVVLRAIQGENRMEAGDWGSYAINDVSAILTHFFTFTPEDYTRDPKLRDLIEEGDSTRNPAQRQERYSEAIREITNHADWLPLASLKVTYAHSRSVTFTAYPDELPRFYLCRWATTSATGNSAAN